MPPILRPRQPQPQQQQQVNPLPTPSKSNSKSKPKPKSPPSKTLIKKPSPSAPSPTPTTPNPPREPPNPSRRRSIRLNPPDSPPGKSSIDMDFHVLDLDLDLNVVDIPDSDSDSGHEDENKKRKLGDQCPGFFSVASGSINDKGKTIMISSDEEEADAASKIRDFDGKGARRLSRAEKGKGVMMDSDPMPMHFDMSLDLELKLGVGDIDLNVGLLQPDPVEHPVAPVEVNVGEVGGVEQPYMMAEHRLRQNKVIAKQNAARFARVSSVERVGDDADSDAEKEVAQDGDEDWPGPFSTAMKIIRERESKNAQSRHFRVDNSGTPSVVWNPSAVQGRKEKCRSVPSLHDLCMKGLVENSDAITSLEGVPEVLVHRLVSRLCRCRKMTQDILGLLFRGSPSEIRIPDCSWIAEEQFTPLFQACNTENLMVLQLDQCGRCMPDYTVQQTLANKGLPVLTTISLKGACRLSDIGLKALISSASALRSINISQCSLITETGIDAIVDSLGSGLRELYLDDCQTLNAMRLLPALERLTNLEVLSLVGIPSVCDKFIVQLIRSIGRNIKELALAHCVKLSDKSLRVIGENCSHLYSLDLMNLTKLSDTGIGYLANCCQAIQTLKFCRNTFSDEAIAAFLETCGESLKELSLNNVKVGTHTAISITRRCRNLVCLDVSWCRSLTDECLGVIADSCESLRMLKIFGCTQITGKFRDGHSNQDLNVIGIKLTPIVENLKEQDLLCGPLLYSAVSP